MWKEREGWRRDECGKRGRGGGEMSVEREGGVEER